MRREYLLGLLQRYHTQDGDEAKMVAQTRAFIEEHEDCFERSCVPGHITGSAWVLDRSRRYVLLTHHRKLDRWFQLGGHSDGDPNTLEVARREAEEESGLTRVRPMGERIFDVDVHPIPARGEEPEHLHYDIRFLFEGDKEVPLVTSDESHEVAWVRLDKVADLNDDRSMARMVEKCMRFCGPMS